MAFNSMKAQIEKKNDLIKKAESIINLAQTENRELTDAETSVFLPSVLPTFHELQVIKYPDVIF